MIELIRIQRLNHTKFVGHFLKFWNGIRHPDAAFAVLRKLVRRAHQFRHARRESETFTFDELVRTRFVVPFHELGFVIEQIEMWRSAGHVQINHAFDFGFEVRLFWRQRI